MNTTLLTKLIQKRLTFPLVDGTDGNSRPLVRQLDAALMKSGFKLSSKLMKYLGGSDFETALNASKFILDAAKNLVGDHIKHNPYFKEFPKNVPDTEAFWYGLMSEYFFTNNLLELPTYGTVQHSYEEMLDIQDAFKPKKVKFKTINLGALYSEEMNNMFSYIAGSNVPVNEEDRVFLEELYKAGYHGPSLKIDFPIRENRAIVNSLRIGSEPIDVDTPTDILRIAAHLSGGDVTLVLNTKFKSFSRPIRRALLSALNEMISVDPEKMEDVTKRRERFKRLNERLHSYEYKDAYPEAYRLFEYARGEVKILTWGDKVQTALLNQKFTKAINLLSEKPGYLIRSVDNIARKASDSQFTNLLEAIKDNSDRVSGRVILSLIEHLGNRRDRSNYRLFINSKGTGYASGSPLEPIASNRVDKIQKVLWKSLAQRIKPIKCLSIDSRVNDIAVPISEKNKSEGFRVLSRGSIVKLDSTKNILRFFIYWKQSNERTDYDLSVQYYDNNFEPCGHLSYTSLTSMGATHSGDITSAPDGASEFISLDLNKVPNEVAYIVPTINNFTGETFAQCAECFFGFMSLSNYEKGKPFEPTAVEMKFALKSENKVGIPMVFERTEEGFVAKWLDIYAKGAFWGNRVEITKFSTALLAKTLVKRKFLTFKRLLELYKDKAETIVSPSKADVYIGFEKPESVKAGVKVYTLDNLKELIPV